MDIQFLKIFTQQIWSLHFIRNNSTWNPPPPNGAPASSGPGSRRYPGVTIPLRHIIFGATPLDEWSARRRDLYLTTNNTHDRQISMRPAGFESAIPASERPLGSAYTRKHVKEMETTAVYISLTTSTADCIRCNCFHYHFKIMIWLIIWRNTVHV
jgi:hypothetical protein